MEKHKTVSPIDREVGRFYAEQCLGTGKRLVVAVSGGPDSVALLLALNRLKDELGLDLHGAHLDHGIRGKYSSADARFVVELFKDLGLAITVKRADVPAFRKNKRLSLEDAARRVRYAFLSRVAKEQKASSIALGHTLDDQAETILLNLLRGTSLPGLRGMQPIASRTGEHGEIFLVRPLLKISRAQTATYCDSLGVKPRLDESNASMAPTRNRLRLQLIPELEQYNPAVKQALVRLSRGASDVLTFLDDSVEAVWHKAVSGGSGWLSIDKSHFIAMAPSIQTHLLRRVLLEVKGDLDGIYQSHIDTMARLLPGRAGRSLDLPNGIRFHSGYGEVTISQGGEDLCPLPLLNGENDIRTPGETVIQGWRITAEVVRNKHHLSSEPELAPGFGRADMFTALLSASAVGDRLSVRTRSPGDTFQPLGMLGRKKLQDFMVDSKVPRAWRDRVPLVVTPTGIAWVVGWRVADWAKTQRDSGSALHVKFQQRRAGHSNKAVSWI